MTQDPFLSKTYQKIYQTIRNIPKGRVATYGQIAELAGFPRQARMVGYALHALPNGSNVPWHRVINAKGRISQHGDPMYSQIQQKLLQAEGISFDEQDRISLNDYQWHPVLD